MMPPLVKYPATPTDLDIFARTLFGEARGEPKVGQYAVAWCIRHRAEIARDTLGRTGKRHPLFGDGSIASACQAKWQFSCWNPNDPTKAAMCVATARDPAFENAMAIVRDVVADTHWDNFPGTTHYFNPAAVKAVPAWVKTAVFVAAIGHHRFYRDVA